ncbi:hypothetical protein EK904_003208, partial [Melospiza melodia maxima]
MKAGRNGTNLPCSKCLPFICIYKPKLMHPQPVTEPLMKPDWLLQVLEQSPAAIRQSTLIAFDSISYLPAPIPRYFPSLSKKINGKSWIFCFLSSPFDNPGGKSIAQHVSIAEGSEKEEAKGRRDVRRNNDEEQREEKCPTLPYTQILPSERQTQGQTADNCWGSYKKRILAVFDLLLLPVISTEKIPGKK